MHNVQPASRPVTLVRVYNCCSCSPAALKMGCSCRVQTEEGIQAGWRRSDLPWHQLAKGNICMQTRSEVTNQVKQGHEDASAWDWFNTMPVTNQSLKKIHMKWLQTTDTNSESRSSSFSWPTVRRCRLSRYQWVSLRAVSRCLAPSRGDLL